MSTLKIGALFAGYGGLDLAVSSVLDAEPVWFSEFDKGPSKILAHRFPDVPNHGDITKIDWSQVEPVDILTGGSPCQDLSHAGQRAGMTGGTRSNLWVAMREAIAQLRPSLVVWENVGGAFSAAADSAVEPCAGCVGEGSGTHLRALGRVLGDLASLGFDAEWVALRAADVGAPHGRLRVFVAAQPADKRHEWGWASRDGWTGPANSNRGSSVVTLPTPTARDWKNVGNPAKTASRMADRGQPLGEVVVNALLPTPAVNDMGASYTPEEWDAWTDRMKAEHGNGNDHGKSLHIEAARLLPTPTAADSAASGGSSASDITLTDAVVRTNLGEQENPRHAVSTEGRPGQGLRDVRRASDSQAVPERETRGSDGVSQEEALLAEVREQPEGDPARQSPMEGAPDRATVDVPGVRDDRAPACTSHRPEPSEQRAGQSHHPLCLVSSAAALAGGSGLPCGCNTNWGQYEAAIRRWEHVLGRCAPAPTQLGPKGRPRLDARFSEFMMGLPAGWVTDVPGITRNEALKALGNGVVPQQAAAALRVLLSAGEVAA